MRGAYFHHIHEFVMHRLCDIPIIIHDCAVLVLFRVDSEDVRLMLWDTAGQEEFDAITAAYYRGAHACVLAYSSTDRDSFDAIPLWKSKVFTSFIKSKHLLIGRNFS